MNPNGDFEALNAALRRLDGKGYKAYKGIRGAWTFPTCDLHIDHVQGDPFAEPSRVRIDLHADHADLPQDAYRSISRAWGTAALLARTFSARARETRGHVGAGRSGEIRMEDPGQVVGPQTAVRIDSAGNVEARFTVGLPANGRRVLGSEAARLLGEVVPTLVASSLLAKAHDQADIELCAATNEDAVHLRAGLEAASLVGFIADGACLPRRSGIDDRPLVENDVVPFESPPALRVTLDVPNAGALSGMGVREGVTLIVGGGFHGKSTVLRALESGVFNHPPGDGRERVVARSDSVKVRAEDGRSVQSVDISSFIDDLPHGRSTEAFTTPNASGSTSQAATIMESLEAGARVLLVDEDTSATNFMIRDRRMQELVPKSGEPITPFVDRVQALHDRLSVSSVLVIGGSGDYLDVADHVIRMNAYKPEDVTAQAGRIAESHPTGRISDEAIEMGAVPERRLPRRSLSARRGRRDRYIRVPDERTLLFGEETIDLAAVEQIHGRGQIRAIGGALALMATLLESGPMTVDALLRAVEEAVEADGLDALEARLTGDLAAVRRFEVAAALNRVRSLRVD